MYELLIYFIQNLIGRGGVWWQERKKVKCANPNWLMAVFFSFFQMSSSISTEFYQEIISSWIEKCHNGFTNSWFPQGVPEHGLLLFHPPPPFPFSTRPRRRYKFRAGLQSIDLLRQRTSCSSVHVSCEQKFVGRRTLSRNWVSFYCKAHDYQAAKVELISSSFSPKMY